jgi:acyl phosphate:glycerol-3-phosphate acyltransferase
LLAYIVGSIPVGVIVGKFQGFDPRAVGSSNVGTTNVGRAGGTIAAAATFIGDLSKGLLPVLLARAIVGLIPMTLAAVGFAAFLGSIASIFLGFKGGRGVATSLGIWLGLAPLAIAIAVAIFIATLIVSRIISLASLAAAVSLPPSVAASHSPRPYILLAILMSALVVSRHRMNIERLLAGEEQRIGGMRKG